MNSCELVTLISTLACTLSKIYTKEELTIMAAAFSQLGETLETILTHDELCNIRAIENTCTTNAVENPLLKG